MQHVSLFILSFLFILTACNQEETGKEVPGFDASQSDPEAIRLADSVLAALGGQQAWDQAPYIAWTFFGNRRLIWDKTQDRVRIFAMNGDIDMVVNTTDTSGIVKRGQELVEDPDSLSHYLEMGYRWWINDSYWLLMPYKLKDPGVNLTYIGSDTTQQGDTAEVIELTFNEVGITPQNKYHVWIHPESYRITQWAFFPSYGDIEPRFVTPWENYQPYGPLIISDSRGGNRTFDHVEVYSSLPEEVFKDLSPTEY